MAYQGDWRSQQRDRDRDYGMDRSSAPYSYAERDYRWGLGNYAHPRDMAPGADYELHDHDRGPGPRERAYQRDRFDEERLAEVDRRYGYGERRYGARRPFAPDDTGAYGADRVSHIADGDVGPFREERSWLPGHHGEHRGRGPKNYTRSDDRIREDVNDRLSDDPRLDARDIEVLVKDGEVTLSGTVADRLAKRQAEDCADSVSGVKHVQNNLRARPSEDRWAETGISPTDGVTGPR